MGRLPDARYAALDAQYTKQVKLAAEIAEMEKTVSGYDRGGKSAEKFVAMIDNHQDFDTMTTDCLMAFCDYQTGILFKSSSKSCKVIERICLNIASCIANSLSSNTAWTFFPTGHSGFGFS